MKDYLNPYQRTAAGPDDERTGQDEVPGELLRGSTQRFREASSATSVDAVGAGMRL